MKPPLRKRIARGFTLIEVLVALTIVAVALSARAATTVAPYAAFLVMDADSGHVQFRVVDNGSGIAAADLERVFEYYYTTKDTGTGLGLSITQRIVHQHQGLIDVESAVGSGTAVTISLPPG